MRTNNFTMTLPSRSCNESFARVTVAAFATQLDPTLEEINDIKTAVSDSWDKITKLETQPFFIPLP